MAIEIIEELSYLLFIQNNSKDTIFFISENKNKYDMFISNSLLKCLKNIPDSVFSILEETEEIDEEFCEIRMIFSYKDIIFNIFDSFTFKEQENEQNEQNSVFHKFIVPEEINDGLSGIYLKNNNGGITVKFFEF